MPRIDLPALNTVVQRKELSLYQVPRVPPPEPEQTVEASQDVGTQLNVGLLTAMQPAPAAASVGRFIPRTPKETRKVLHLIQGDTTGRNNDNYTQKELSQIARNLDLVSSGRKRELAARITNTIKSFFANTK